MIDKELLNDIGFVRAEGWDHEVWYHDCDFWVHFDGAFEGLDGQQISGSASRSEFIAMFLEQFRRSIRDSATIVF